MTEDTSPENLRKFLESDDPALIRMGLSMAKGAGVPDEMLGEILWMYIFHDDKTIRAAAKSTFIKLAPEDAKQAVKENWKASYLKHGRWTKSGHIDSPLGILGKALCHTSVSLVEPLIKALRDSHVRVRRNAAEALGIIGEPAVEPLLEVLLDVRWLKELDPLGKIGDARVVEQLIRALGADDWHVRTSAAGALGRIGDVCAVEPLIKALRDEETDVRTSAAEALGEIGDERAVEPLIETLRDTGGKAVEALGKIGDMRAVEPLLEALGDGNRSTRQFAALALGEIGDQRAIEPLRKALDDKDSDVRWYASNALYAIQVAHEEPVTIKDVTESSVTFPLVLNCIQCGSRVTVSGFPFKCYCGEWNNPVL